MALYAILYADLNFGYFMPCKEFNFTQQYTNSRKNKAMLRDFQTSSFT